MDENWIPVAGFEGLYSVSSLGTVRRDRGRTSTGKRWAGGPLKPRYNQDGYAKYTLYRAGKPHYVLGHRLVCEAFHGPPPEGKPLALHRNDMPGDNRPENLYWGSLSDNQSDILLNGNNYGRNKTQCVHGHEYTAENTYWNPKTRARSCKTCRAKYTKEANNRRRESNGDRSN